MKAPRSIAGCAQGMASGSYGSLELCRHYLERIERYDGRLGSVIEINPDAQSIARELDRERRAGRLRGPLHGVPVLLKDNIDTGDRMQTTAGSLALEGSPAQRDASLVRRLRRAGAVILGKTNLSEWANFRGRRSVSGWSSRGGLCRNPHALDRSACGSSSGSAAAVAAGFAPAAVGTETDGSIICPAQTCGIVGLKPTVGLVSRSGIVPIAHSQDTAGPMASCVADAALLLQALAGPDPRDSATSAAPRRIADYGAALDPDGLRGAEIGVARSLAGSDPKVLAVFESSLTALRDRGARLIELPELRVTPELSQAELELLLFEFKADLDAYLASRRGAKVRSLRDVTEFNDLHRSTVMPWFGQEHMLEAERRGTLRSRAYLRAVATCRSLARARGIDAAMREHGLDAIVTPSGGPAWLIDLVNGDAHSSDVRSTTLAAVAGYPHITVPAGFVNGLPLGLSFFAGPWQEATLLRLAFAFEHATGARREPAFAAHATLEA